MAKNSGQRQARAIQVLLLKDVDDLGRSGDVVRARPGYVRNFLMPQKLALVADARALQLQARLQEERRKLAEVERKESEQWAKRIEGTRLHFDVKIDPAGHMYGSISAQDIVAQLLKQGVEVERRAISLPHPFKKVGRFPLTLRLKEGVTAGIVVEIVPEGGVLAPEPEEQAEAQEEAVEQQ
jgi:large subunit ribosomal protein L9